MKLSKTILRDCTSSVKIARKRFQKLRIWDTELLMVAQKWTLESGFSIGFNMLTINKSLIFISNCYIWSNLGISAVLEDNISASPYYQYTKQNNIAHIVGKISRTNMFCESTYQFIRIHLGSIAHIVRWLQYQKTHCKSTSTCCLRQLVDN